MKHLLEKLFNPAKYERRQDAAHIWIGEWGDWKLWTDEDWEYIDRVKREFPRVEDAEDIQWWADVAAYHKRP